MQTKKLSLQNGYELIYSNGIQCQIGFGASGTVHLAKCLKTGQTVAIKRVKSKLVHNQIGFLSELNHPNIIKLLGSFHDQKQEFAYLVLEFADNGNLFDYIKENQIKDRRIINGVFYSVCDAIDYLHSKNIMHRDIKPQNILLDRKNMVKLCDFGFASIRDQRLTIGGTIEYMAPEILNKKAYNYKVDIWALGVLYYELIEGTSPFVGKLPEQIYSNIQKPIYFTSKFRPQQISLISSILKINPNERPQIRDIMKHPCLNTIQLINVTNISSSQQQKDQRSTSDSLMIQQKSCKIKIMEIKDLLEPTQRKIQLMSIKNLQEGDQLVFEQEQPPKRGQKSNLLLSVSRQKISLKKYSKKP